MSTALEPAGTPTQLSVTAGSIDLIPDDGHYRVAAFPADYALTDDVMLRDDTGRAYLLSHGDELPSPIEEDTANSLGMFFEPSQDSSWHTITELRRIIYGIDETTVTVH